MVWRSRRVVCFSILFVFLAVGVGRLSAAEKNSRTVDCGHLLIPAAGLTMFRGWAKGVSCPAARALLDSEAVARGLPKGTFVPPRLFRANGFVCADDPFELACWVGDFASKRNSITAQHLAAARSG